MRLAIIGTAGIPAQYGGFETLVENLCRGFVDSDIEVAVWCSSVTQENRHAKYLGANLFYVDRSANGISSILYDIISLREAIKSEYDVVLVLGVSGAIFFPIMKYLHNIKIITNIDGIEWKRQKWGFWAKSFLRFSEYLAVRYSDVVVADNVGIKEHVVEAYSVEPTVITYGGDHVLDVPDAQVSDLSANGNYFLSLCRIEKENNVDLILEAFSVSKEKLIFVGNWNHSRYGRELKEAYSKFPNIKLSDPIYDQSELFSLRYHAKGYIHGHSAGGTNPSLVEMMHFGLPVFAFDCVFNRYTTEQCAFYFQDKDSLTSAINHVSDSNLLEMGVMMKSIANKVYRWDKIIQDYYKVIKVSD